MKSKLAISLALSTLLLTACSYTPNELSADEAIKTGGSYLKQVKVENPTINKDIGDKENLKILTNYSVDIETKNLEEDKSSLEAKVHSYGGYVSNSNGTQGSKGSSSVKENNISVKVSRKYADEFNSYLKENFKVSGETTASVDVSNEYENLKSKIKTIEEREKRLKETYEESKNLKDVYSLDKRIAELSLERQDLEKDLNNISTRLEYFKVEINFKKVKKFSVGEEKGEVAKEFSSSMGLVSSVFSSIFKFFVRLIPAIVFVVIPSALIYSSFLVYKFMRKRKSK